MGEVDGEVDLYWEVGGSLFLSASEDILLKKKKREGGKKTILSKLMLKKNVLR